VISGFPKRYRGLYWNVADSTELIISEHCVVRIDSADIRALRSDLDSGQCIVGDSIIELGDDVRMRIRVQGDSLFGQWVWSIDTLVDVGRGDVLKKAMGSVFLNVRLSDSSWEVRRLDLSHGGLTISRADSADALLLNNSEVEVIADTVSITYSPTRQQFRRFSRAGGLSAREEYVRVMR
jgi:hypothetical protein